MLSTISVLALSNFNNIVVFRYCRSVRIAVLCSLFSARRSFVSTCNFTLVDRGLVSIILAVHVRYSTSQTISNLRSKAASLSIAKIKLDYELTEPRWLEAQGAFLRFNCITLI